jgi:hypothetical protein
MIFVANCSGTGLCDGLPKPPNPESPENSAALSSAHKQNGGQCRLNRKADHSAPDRKTKHTNFTEVTQQMVKPLFHLLVFAVPNNMSLMPSNKYEFS